jgi:hypothetical protein
VPENPVVIKFTLSAIFDLLTQECFPNDTKIIQKSALIKQAFEEYLNKTSIVYCENTMTQSIWPGA